MEADFFESGGSSLAAGQLVAQMPKQLKISGFSVRDLFANRTIAAVAKLIRTMRGVRPPNGDLVTACADGIARVWTQDPTRMAPDEMRITQRAEADAAATQAASNKTRALLLNNVTPACEMAKHPEKKYENAAESRKEEVVVSR